MIRILVAFLGVMVLAGPLMAAGRPMTVDDLLAVKGVSDPQVSPDGTQVVYVVSEIDRAANKANTSLWLVPVAGGESRRLTTTPGTNTHPRWRPDGKAIAFVSSRGGSAQVWLLPVDGGEPRQITKLPLDVSGPIWSPDGMALAFTAEVYPGTSPEETAEKDKAKAEAKSSARTFDALMIRHWMSWDEGKRSHLFTAQAETGEAKDLIPGWNVNVPPAPFGDSSDYAWAADGASLAFTSEPVEHTAWSTNSDIWQVPVAGGTPSNLTAANKGADAKPAYSADGALLAYVSQARAGFEADQWVLNYRPSGAEAAEPIPVTKGLDRPVMSFAWDGDSANLLSVIDDGGYETVMSFPTIGRRAPLTLLKEGVFGSVSRAKDGALIFVKHSADRPAEIYRANGDGSDVTALTHHNDALIQELDLQKAERFTFKGANSDEVQGWLVLPPGFDAKKKYPVVFLIHGGPQGSWHDEWHGRWNYGLFAAPGYCLVAINPRGSTGFGQKFTDEISKDWNGKVYDDLMLGLDHALRAYPFLDADRVAAAGGSYGGYMVNWLAGHTDRFKALISHAGIYDLTSMNATTEELWFPEWEFGGMPWQTPEVHLTMSPSTAAANFKTPTLVIHGALDFRVPDAQGLAMFTALQRQGVPSRYLWFPDEGHWIAKPANRVVWWDTVHGWLKTYIGSVE